MHFRLHTKERAKLSHRRWHFQTRDSTFSKFAFFVFGAFDTRSFDYRKQLNYYTNYQTHFIPLWGFTTTAVALWTIHRQQNSCFFTMFVVGDWVCTKRWVPHACPLVQVVKRLARLSTNSQHILLCHTEIFYEMRQERRNRLSNSLPGNNVVILQRSFWSYTNELLQVGMSQMTHIWADSKRIITRLHNAYTYRSVQVGTRVTSRGRLM